MPAHRIALTLCTLFLGIFQANQTTQTPVQPPPKTGQTASPTNQTSSQPPASTQASPTGSNQPIPVVTADLNPAIPGQTVTFYWPDGATKVLAAGGGFGERTEVKGQTFISDVPTKPTTYTFNLWYPDETAKSGKTGDQNENKGNVPTAQPPTGHQMCKVTVQLYSGKFEPLATYHDRYHWRVDCPSGWNRDVVPEVDPANNALVYFQPEEDSPERMSVAIMPVGKGTTSAQLMQKAMDDAPTQYDVIVDVQQKDTIQCGVPATWLTFRGIDRSNPDVPVKSMVLAFIRDGRGYLISARTRLSLFDKKQTLLRCLVRSFAFETQAPEKPANAQNLAHRSQIHRKDIRH